jgi:hypothetical protein
MSAVSARRDPIPRSREARLSASKLRLGKRQVGLGAETCVPARCCFLKPPQLLVKREQQQRERVGERNLRKLSLKRPGEQEVPSFKSTFELAVRAPLRGHDHMFARSRARQRSDSTRASLSLAIAPVVGSPALPIFGVLRSPFAITPAGVGSPSLAVLGVLAFALSIAAALGSLLVAVRLCQRRWYSARCSAFACCHRGTQALGWGARPSFRERPRLNSARGFSSPHFVQRFKSSEAGVETR